MDPVAVRELFDRTLRTDPPSTIGIEWTWFDGVRRATQGAQHFIGWWDFPRDRMAAIVAREAAHARSVGGGLTWQVMGHDRPEGLAQALADAGFEDQGLEKWLALEASAAANLRGPPGADIRLVCTEEQLASYLAVARKAFDDDGFAEDVYRPRLHDPTMRLYTAYLDGEPVATGRLEVPNGCPFAGLFDGGVVAQHRGAGLYRAIVAARAAEAVRRRARYLCVNARETSRPILERLGFELFATMHQWKLEAQSP